MNTATLQHAVIALVVAVAIVGYVRWEAFLIHEISGAKEVRYLTKQAWIVVCLIWIPIGAILYLIYGRTR